MALRNDRTGWWAAKDAEDRAARPFDLFLRLKGRSGEVHWGRWTSAESAHEIGNKELRNTSSNPSMHPLSKKCTGYRVIDSRTDAVVTDPALVAAIERAKAA